MRRRAIALVIASLFALGVWSCQKSQANASSGSSASAGSSTAAASGSSATAALNLPECPRGGYWSKILERKNLGTITLGGPPKLSPLTTDIPEFHDCQRFIKGLGAGATYLPLYAIFARDNLRDSTLRLDRVPDSLGTKADSQSAQVFGKPVATGEILAFDLGYPSLGIQIGYNCLFIYGDPSAHSGLSARVLPVGANDSQCLGSFDTSSTAGTRLEVQRTRFPAKDLVPGVARWDRDYGEKQQLIGHACGNAWCDIGPKGFVKTKPHGSAVGTPALDVIAIKGYYDEQRLASPPTSTSPLHVGNVIGTLVADPGLSADGKVSPDHSRYFNKWILVATAGLTSTSPEYAKKFGFEASPIPAKTNRVFLCYSTNTPATCGTDKFKDPPNCPTDVVRGWWGKIVAGKDSSVFCVNRRGHESVSIPVPPVVRWRWALKDETMWISCIQGCCEVEAGSREIY
jgi:hypothetical protein